MVVMVAFKTVTLLIFSNIFMTFAWYGHLKFKSRPLFAVILVSWGIALFEYCLQVPANRIGFGYFSGAQLKLIQEVITFSVFGVFSWFYLEQKPTLYDSIAFVFIIAAVGISVFQPRG
ncbi:MAG: DMT family protein [Deltaproteobacteria bacterium]|nr:DMT family protein [Deltaproteobacteria bacterium]